MCAECKYSHFQQNSAQNVERKLIIRIQKQIQTWNGIPGEVGRELMQACQPVPKTMFPNARRNIQFPHNTFWPWTRCSEHHTCIMLSCCVQVFRPTKVGQSRLMKLKQFIINLFQNNHSPVLGHRILTKSWNSSDYAPQKNGRAL